VAQQDRPPDEGANPAPTDGAAGVAPRRRPYHTPNITEYGSVSKMTQGSLTVQNDFFMSGMRMNCL
jgi:hypothetical protein